MSHGEIAVRDRHGNLRAIVLVDAEDVDWLSAYTWRIRSGYASREVMRNYERQTFYMHREIMGLARGDRTQVDHVNRDPLDNRRSNLRLATMGQQRQNMRSYPGSSRYRGVSWDRRRQKWRAYAGLNGKQHWLGEYVSEAEAAAVARAWRLENMQYATD